MGMMQLANEHFFMLIRILTYDFYKVVVRKQEANFNSKGDRAF